MNSIAPTSVRTESETEERVMPRITMREAISQALWEEMERDENVFIMGEEVGVWGGTYAVTKGFYDHFGPKRVLDTPMAETAMQMVRDSLDAFVRTDVDLARAVDLPRQLQDALGRGRLARVHMGENADVSVSAQVFHIESSAVS